MIFPESCDLLGWPLFSAVNFLSRFLWRVLGLTIPRFALAPASFVSAQPYLWNQTDVLFPEANTSVKGNWYLFQIWVDMKALPVIYWAPPPGQALKAHYIGFLWPSGQSHLEARPWSSSSSLRPCSGAQQGWPQHMGHPDGSHGPPPQLLPLAQQRSTPFLTSPHPTIHFCLSPAEGRASAQPAPHTAQQGLVWLSHPSSTHLWPEPQRHWLFLRFLDSEAVQHQGWNPASSGVGGRGKGDMGNWVTQPIRSGELRHRWIHAFPLSSHLTALSTWVPHSQPGSCPRWLSNWLIFLRSYVWPGNTPPFSLSHSLPLSSLLPLLLLLGKAHHATLAQALLYRKLGLRLCWNQQEPWSILPPAEIYLVLKLIVIIKSKLA